MVFERLGNETHLWNKLPSSIISSITDISFLLIALFIFLLLIEFHDGICLVAEKSN